MKLGIQLPALTLKHGVPIKSTGTKEAESPRRPPVSPKPHATNLSEIGAEEFFLDPGEGSSGVAGALAPPSPPDKHPFAHVPTLEPGITTRPFNVRHARASQWAYSLPYSPLAQMRVLLSRETLDFTEAETVLLLAEMLMAHCLFHQTAGISCIKSRGAVEKLGIGFLLLDSIVAGLKAVGQNAPSELWKELAAAVPHTIPGSARSSGNEHYANLAVRVSAALEILMTGNLPLARERIELKRMLFCSDDAPPKFKKHAFDPWKTDCSDASTENQADSDFF